MPTLKCARVTAVHGAHTDRHYNRIRTAAKLDATHNYSVHETGFELRVDNILWLTYIANVGTVCVSIVRRF